MKQNESNRHSRAIADTCVGVMAFAVALTGFFAPDVSMMMAS